LARTPATELTGSDRPPAPPPTPARQQRRGGGADRRPPHLDTVAAGVAPAALPPGQTREVAGGHAVTSIGHGLLFHLVSWRIDGRGAAVGGAGHGSPCHRRVTTGSSPRSPSLLVQELTLNMHVHLLLRLHGMEGIITRELRCPPLHKS